jgi:hypothetical protein
LFTFDAVVADQLGAAPLTRLVGQVGELGPGLLLDEDGEHVVLALGAGAAHLELRVGLLRRVDEFLRGLVGRRRVGPEGELVQGDDRDRQARAS